MAESVQTYTKVSVGKLQVNSIFTSLMATATDKDSMYIKAKESMLDYLGQSALNEQEKAAVLSDLISKLTLEMTNTAMSSAIKIAIEDRDSPYVLSKLNEDILMSQEQRDKVATDILYTTAQIAKMDADAISSTIQNWKDQATLYWATGVDTAGWDTTVYPTLPNTVNLPEIKTGSGYFEVEFGKTKQYELLSSSVRNYGALSFDYNESGALDTVVEFKNSDAVGSYSPWNGLVKQQHAVAIRQETGFTDNMRQHAANSSANMIGLLLSSDTFSAAADYENYLSLWVNAMQDLTETCGTTCP